MSRKRKSAPAKGNAFSFIIAVIIAAVGFFMFPGQDSGTVGQIRSTVRTAAEDGFSKTVKSTDLTGFGKEGNSAVSASSASLKDIPPFSGKPYVTVNNNVPFFTKKEITPESFEVYAPLDSLGRCGVAESSVGRDLMPKEKRGSISSVKPSGWKQAKYDFVDGKSLYNRCHLIGFQLTGENANERNLITGTRYMNVDGMLPFENMIADYVKETGNHVMYRVTPIYDGDNLVAAGVLMEALSVEDGGKDVCFNVFCYNNQPGVEIDYLTGRSRLAD